MDEEACDIGLGLCIGGGWYESRKRRLDQEKPERKPQFHVLFPTHIKEEGGGGDQESNVSLLRLRTSSDQEEEEVTDRDIAHDSGGSNKKGGSSRKKLRLSKEQSTLLEDSFRQHNTLNPAQKQQLAERLDLRPRQVEVWFQNRRARTKLKQTEVDCEFLKKCCESLSDENRRLKKELQELRSLKKASSVYALPKSAAAVAGQALCPSCERNVSRSDAGGGTRSGDSNTTFDAVTAGTRPSFYNCTAAAAVAAAADSVKDSSMACCK